MYIFAYTMQLIALLCALACSGLALMQLWQGRSDALKIVEKGHWIISSGLFLASACLLHALYWLDFSVEYVASYTDRILPLFYRLTAFWAGQPGSMLFWALSVGLSGSLFAMTKACKKLSPSTKLWYWTFFYIIMAFFALVLTSWSNPFQMITPAPHDGNGLNPLLQNPGMIFHPPLLFLGYGGFTVPSCLAIAQVFSGRDGEERWFRLTRPFLVLAWLFLTSGIILGAWWAYMELGWGGYWAWDPVENASLIPWLIATAMLHTLVVQERRGKLGRVNVALIALTTVSAFFATYLVRSGVVDSVHAFGDGSVGTPLTIFVIAGIIISFWAAFVGKIEGEALANINSREGFLTLVAWILLAVACIILLATMWPVISKIWSATPRGLDATFYNRVCLPLGTALLIMLSCCPWLSWDGGIRDQKRFYALLLVFIISGVAIFALGYKQIVALLAASSAITIFIGLIMQVFDKANMAYPQARSAFGAHIGLAFVALGIAFSGPYAQEKDLLLAQDQKDELAGYTAKLLEIENGEASGYAYLRARLEISKDGKVLGEIAPERRIYEKFGTMQFSEVDTIPSLGNEIYASLLGMDDEKHVLVQLSIKPLVNWFWIGGTFMCLLPLFGLGRKKIART